MLLTGVASDDARTARWEEIDLHRRVWLKPVPARGKGAVRPRARRIVLGEAAHTLLAAMHKRRRSEDYLFPLETGGGPGAAVGNCVVGGCGARGSPRREPAGVAPHVRLSRIRRAFARADPVPAWTRAHSLIGPVGRIAFRIRAPLVDAVHAREHLPAPAQRASMAQCVESDPGRGRFRRCSCWRRSPSIRPSPSSWAASRRCFTSCARCLRCVRHTVPGSAPTSGGLRCTASSLRSRRRSTVSMPAWCGIRRTRSSRRSGGHHAANGHFPERLSELVPVDLPEIPSAAPLLIVDRWFRYRRSAQGFELSYVAGFLVDRVYDSRTGAWSVRD